MKFLHKHHLYIDKYEMFDNIISNSLNSPDLSLIRYYESSLQHIFPSGLGFERRFYQNVVMAGVNLNNYVLIDYGFDNLYPESNLEMAMSRAVLNDNISVLQYMINKDESLLIYYREMILSSYRKINVRTYVSSRTLPYLLSVIESPYISAELSMYKNVSSVVPRLIRSSPNKLVDAIEFLKSTPYDRKEKEIYYMLYKQGIKEIDDMNYLRKICRYHLLINI